MAQYIEKSAVVAEIERRKKELIEISNDFTNQWACGSLDNILYFLDTLEVKEGDLEKEADIEDAVHGTVDYPLIGCDFPNIYPNYKELKEYCDRKGIKDNDKVKLILIKDT